MSNHFDLLSERFENIDKNYEKLILIVGNKGSGKTRLLWDYSNSAGYQIFNINLGVSEKLLQLPANDWEYSVLSILQETLSSSKEKVMFLDNLEVLFNTQLHLNPLKLLRFFSRNKIIVATWNGRFENDQLIYAKPGHPEHRAETNIDFPIIDLNKQKNYENKEGNA